MKNIIKELNNIVLDKMEMSNYTLIKNTEYQGYYLRKSSSEHYRLLAYISEKLSGKNFLDIGTLLGSSALALSTNKENKVYSFNIHDQLQLTSRPANIKFIIDNVLKYKNLILESTAILLDTKHDGIFEYQFYNHLKCINYKGCLILDDIHMSSIMETFWDHIDLEKLDISEYGHITGTGVVYFD